MNNTEMIKELRALTQAGMKDCKESLVEAGWDLQKAVDIVKTKGLNIVSGREGKVAAEGVVSFMGEQGRSFGVLTEVNSETDFVSRNPQFWAFVGHVNETIWGSVVDSKPFSVSDVEARRIELVSSVKEQIVVRRWAVQEAVSPNAKVFTYVHSNNKIGVLLTLLAPSVEAANSDEFIALGEDLAMQVAALNPVSISVDRLNRVFLDRQKAIFTTQLVDLKKPQAAWGKILDGKLNKWYTEVCLLNQESVVVPKTTVQQVIKTVADKLGGDIEVVNFVRYQVGEGIERAPSADFAVEVAKMSGV